MGWVGAGKTLLLFYVRSVLVEFAWINRIYAHIFWINSEVAFIRAFDGVVCVMDYTKRCYAKRGLVIWNAPYIVAPTLPPICHFSPRCLTVVLFTVSWPILTDLMTVLPTSIGSLSLVLRHVSGREGSVCTNKMLTYSSTYTRRFSGSHCKLLRLIVKGTAETKVLGTKTL